MKGKGGEVPLGQSGRCRNRAVRPASPPTTFSEQVRTAELGEAVVITRHGKPVAALVPAGDLDTLLRLRSQGPEGGLASVAGGWEGSEELVEIVGASRRRGRRNTGALD